MKSRRIQVIFNSTQLSLANKHAGVARYAFNWGLAECNNALENHKRRPSAYDLQKRYVAEVKSKNPWCYDVSSSSQDRAMVQVDAAFIKHFHKEGGSPRFKKKGKRDSFYLKGNIQVKDEKIKLPKLGWVKLTEKISVDKIKYVVISRTAKRWFISLSVSFEPYKTLKKRATIGVDLGVKVLATLSDGKTFENRKPYAQYKRKLKLAQRHLSKLYRKGQEQTKNYSKQLLKVQRLHYRISCIRNDSIHRLTTYLAKNHSQIAIEDLNVRGMSRNHKLASAILDGGFYEFRRQLEYKTKWYGSELIIANRFYPSTKTCSHCGSIQSMSLNQRVYNCPNCKISIDRDLNAAINLENILAKNAHVCAEDETSQDCASDHPVKHDSAEILNKCGTFTGLN